MRAPKPTPRTAGERNSLFWDMLTLERMMTGPVIHLIYWCGLGLIALFGFTVIGAAVGVAIRGGALEGTLLAIPVLAAGFLMIGALALLWRGACEFYLAIFRIAEDLRVMRTVAERRAANIARARPSA